jgi:hypothetical protein
VACVADEMPEGNDEYLEIFKEFKLDWFRKSVPFEERK